MKIYHFMGLKNLIRQVFLGINNIGCINLQIVCTVRIWFHKAISYLPCQYKSWVKYIYESWINYRIF